AVGPAGAEIAASIIDPPLFPGLKQVAQLSNIFTIGLLPPSLRARYGYSWSAVHEAALSAAITMGQLTIPLLPNLVRLMPQARGARARRADAVQPRRRRPAEHGAAPASP